MKRILLLLSLFAGLSAFGQEARGDMPADVFYLLPEFRQGMVYFSGQGPGQGELNICAVDQTLRFMDKGEELSSSADNILRVVIDTVVFVHVDGAFYRLYPVAGNVTPVNKRTIRKLFPARKDALDAWLKNHALPKTLDDTRAFLARLSSGEAL